MMMTVLGAALFLLGATIAAATIVTTVRAYWPAVASLRAAGSFASEEQEIRVFTTSIDVTANAAVLRPDFSRGSRHRARALRAAA